MTERTYGEQKLTLSQLEGFHTITSPMVIYDLAAHIRELQAEVAKLKNDLGLAIAFGKQGLSSAEEEIARLKLQHHPTCNYFTNPIGSAGCICEVGNRNQLKAERREFGLRIANAILAACQSKGYPGEMYKTHIAAIVEQELNK